MPSVTRQGFANSNRTSCLELADSRGDCCLSRPAYAGTPASHVIAANVEHCSPPTMTVCNAGRPLIAMMCKLVGVVSSTVILRSRIVYLGLRRSLISELPHTNAAPREGHVDFPKSLINAKEYLKDTVAGLKLENRNEALLDIVRCVFVSKKHAFGVPVVPEV